MDNEPVLPPIREQIEIAAAIEDVWRVITRDAPTWLGCLRYNEALGHVFFMQQDRARAVNDDIEGATQCEILALEAPRLFKFSWFVPGFPATYVSFILEPMNEGNTRVLLLHEGWERFPASSITPIRDALMNGWRSFVLPNLKKAAESAQ